MATVDLYREGRKRGLPASAALDYAHQRETIAASDLDWYAEPDVDDPDHGLVVFVADGEEVVDALGAVDVTYWVSDHGNVHYDDDDPYLVAIVAEMMAS